MQKNRINVMHAVFSLETGGLENGVVNLCNRLDPLKFQASICVFKGGGELESRVKQHVELFTLRRLRSNDPTLPFRLALELRRRRIDILHTHSWGTMVEGIVAAKLARTPVIVHGEHGVLERRQHNIHIQRILWKFAHSLTSVASPLADDMSNLVGFPRNRIRVIPNGVDTDRFCPRPDERTSARQQFGLSPTDVVVGMVARLVPVKNHEGVLRALAELAQQGKLVTLALAGCGSLLEKLQSLAMSMGLHGRVHFLGDLDNVHKFLNAIDIFVLNSHSEGMSNTILEAMSCGLPVIVTKVGANSELVVEGQNGLLIPSDNHLALAEAISTLAENSHLRLQMGEAGRARIERDYGIARMVHEYSDLYCDLRDKRLSVIHTPIQPDLSHKLDTGSPR